jgi:hypothetical protein
MRMQKRNVIMIVWCWRGTGLVSKAGRCQGKDCSGAKYRTTQISAPAYISVLNGVFAWFIVPVSAVGRF